MRLLYVRIIGLILLSIIFFLKAWTLLPYWTAMMVSLEMLNHNEKYINQSFFRFYNLLFMSYLILVVADRTRKFHVLYSIEWSFNSLMHILFGLIVCFKISQYLTIFDFKIKNRTLYIALIFNIIGVMNEFMQNMMGNRETFVLIPDAQKDLMMNVVGTMVFMGIEYGLNKNRTPSV